MLKLLRPGQAAARLGVTPRTLINYVKAGLLPAQLTPGGQRRYTLSDIKRLETKVNSTRGSSR